MKLNLVSVGAKGAKQNVVVLHGLLGQARNWGTFLNQLAKALPGVGIHAPDLRNHGRSPHSDKHTVGAMAKDIQALIRNELGGGPVQLIGHSMGGKVAMHLALTQGQALVERLVVVDVAPVEYPAGGGDHLELITAMQRLPLGLVENVPHASELMAHSVPNKHVRDFLLTNLVFSEGAARWLVPLTILKDALPEVRGTHRYELTGERYEGPALWITGGRSNYVTRDMLPRILELFPRAELAVLPEAGHWVHAEEPQAFLELCKDFCGSSSKQQ